MADAKFLSQAAGPDPVLSGHYATKNYLGTVIRVRKIGTGNVTVAGASGVVINWVGGNFTISAQYGIAEIHKTGTDLWMGMLLP
jgi:hypothetical protein